jgi:enoyl-[acyl-carrier protein] reductase I
MEPQTIIARRIARELAPGMLVNLGIGIPTLVANYVPEGMRVFFQSENGLIGTGAPPEEGMAHPTLTDAGGRPVTALPGASTFDSAMSFGLIRGGHLDLTVLGGLQVDQQGHLANWMIPDKMVPGHGRRHGPRDRRQARNRGDAAHRQARIEDRQELHAAHHLHTDGRPGGHRAGGDRLPGWPRHAARDRARRFRGAGDRSDRGRARRSEPGSRNGAVSGSDMAVDWISDMVVDWISKDGLAVGKGATVQEFVATVGNHKFEMDVAPWGEGHVKVNGREIAHVTSAKDRRQAFRELKTLAERYMAGQGLIPQSKRKSSMIPAVKAKLLEGKRGLIVGIANENSIAWGCAKAFRAFGAELAVTYLNDKAKKYVEPLARELEAPIVMPLDVSKPGEMEAVFERIAKDWGKLDFLVHSIAFSPKDALQGRVVDVSREGFLTTMDVSCWTFIRMAHLAEPLMREGGTLFTMTYYGSQMVVKNYNIMGVAKAALEAAVRYIAAELGPKGIRVHAISPGPLATRAASGIPEFDALLDKAKSKAPARSLVSIDDVGVATAFLAHDAARLITGETLYIDGGYHIID